MFGIENPTKTNVMSSKVARLDRLERRRDLLDRLSGFGRVTVSD